jgi:hypothetical protein
MPNDLLTRIPASRVPITDAADGTVTREWYRYLFNLFTITGGGQANSAASSSSGQDLAPLYTPQVSDKRYGAFFDTTTQTAAVINTAYPITLNSTTLTQGAYIGTPTSRAYVDRVGTYNFQFSAQLNKTAAGSGNVFIWYRVNGVDAANSASSVTLAGSSSAVVAAWNFVVNLAAGDYFELVWSTDNTGCEIRAAAASGPVPAIPSVILTVTDNIN